MLRISIAVCAACLMAGLLLGCEGGGGSKTGAVAPVVEYTSFGPPVGVFQYEGMVAEKWQFELTADFENHHGVFEILGTDYPAFIVDGTGRNDISFQINSITGEFTRDYGYGSNFTFSGAFYETEVSGQYGRNNSFRKIYFEGTCLDC